MRFVHVDDELVAAHVIVVLPRARVAHVDRLSALVTKLGPVARDINRTLRFRERCGAVGLFLAVVSRRSTAASIRDTVREIGVELNCFGAATRIPNSRITTAHFY